MDQHRVDADPDPNFQFDANPDTDRHQNDACPHVDLTLSLTHGGR